jgi:hypothetical protein
MAWRKYEQGVWLSYLKLAKILPTWLEKASLHILKKFTLPSLHNFLPPEPLLYCFIKSLLGFKITKSLPNTLLKLLFGGKGQDVNVSFVVLVEPLGEGNSALQLALWQDGCNMPLEDCAYTTK